MTALDVAAALAVLGADRWRVSHPFGPAGIVFDTVSSRTSARARIIISDGPAAGEPDDVDYRHASISRAIAMPDYDDLVLLKAAAWGSDGYAYQVFPAAAEHVNIHSRALHLWGLPDGRRLLPAFGAHGTI